MQDQVDELTQENDLLKNQGTERKLRRRTSKMHSNKPGRIGSVLSDYVNKPNVLKRIDSSSGNMLVINQHFVFQVFMYSTF